MKDPKAMIDRAFANGELVFVLRSRDKHSVAALCAYCTAVRKDKEVEREFVRDIRQLMQDFNLWQEKYPSLVRVPSLKPKELPQEKECPGGAGLCPFCGEIAIHGISTERHRIFCRNRECDVCPSTSYFDTLKEALEVWNRRPVESKAFDILESLDDGKEC